MFMFAAVVPPGASCLRYLDCAMPRCLHVPSVSVATGEGASASSGLDMA